MNKNIVSWQFAFFSAHIYRYFPKIAWSKHLDLYQIWVAYHQDKSRVVPYKMDASTHDNLAQSKAALLVAFHLGYHVQLPYGLAKMGILFDIIIDRSVYQRSKQQFDQMQQQLQFTCQFFFSNDPQLMFKVRANKAKNRHILVFADGATGASPSKNDRIAVPFLADQLLVKRGIAYMSYRFDMDMLPIFVEQDGSIRVEKAIGNSQTENIHQYISRSMTDLFGLLENHIRNFPFLWECWAYLPQYGFLVDKPQKPLEKFNQKVCVSVKLKGQLYIFDRIRYACVILT